MDPEDFIEPGIDSVGADSVFSGALATSAAVTAASACAQTSSTADFKLTLTPGAGGALVVDMATTPAGDLALVAGVDRLVQMVVLWLLTPQGSDPFDPSYGNPLFALLGRPSNATAEDTYRSMVDQAEAEFLSRQQLAAAQGYLATDSMVDRFENTQVSIPAPGQVLVSFDVVAMSGAKAQAITPFSLTVGG